MITIVDYGVGNINAFVNVYKRRNIPIRIAKNSNDLQQVSKLILPGVGHFDYSMKQLNASGMRPILDDLVLDKKVPVIGVCVGMQMMANSSEEGNELGLGWINAHVKKLDVSKIQTVTKLPHMGWNDVVPVLKEHPLFLGLENDAIFYFLHSYYFECLDRSNILAETSYGDVFTSVAYNNNIFGVQFHPEKSHYYGEQLLYNFSRL